MRHHHGPIHIVDEYRNDYSTEVLAVFCDCGELFPELMSELQERYDSYFRLNGAPVVIWGGNTKWVREDKRYYPIELKNRGLSLEELE